VRSAEGGLGIVAGVAVAVVGYNEFNRMKFFNKNLFDLCFSQHEN
jgi:hypothetical protein